jgi:hypothetical protein
MMRHRVWRIWGILAGVAAACAVSAQTLRITVTLVQVDAVVTDSRGERVTDLRPEAFEILQHGKKQPLCLVV